MKLFVVAVLLAVVSAACSSEPAPVNPRMSELIHELNSGDNVAVSNAANELMRMGPAAAPAVPALIRHLGPGTGNNDIAVINALLRIGPGASLPALIEALEDEDENVAAGAAIAIGGFGRAARGAVPALMEALQRPATRSNAAESLR